MINFRDDASVNRSLFSTRCFECDAISHFFSDIYFRNLHLWKLHVLPKIWPEIVFRANRCSSNWGRIVACLWEIMSNLKRPMLRHRSSQNSQVKQINPPKSEEESDYSQKNKFVLINQRFFESFSQKRCLWCTQYCDINFDTQIM